MGPSRASGHTSHYICWYVHACARLMPARFPSSPNEASWLCARTKPNWRDGTVLALFSPCTPHLPKASRPPSLSSRYLGEPWTAEHTRQIWKFRVFVKIYPVSQIPWPGPELESPRLKPQTCLLGFLPLPWFLHLQQLWWCWGLL